MILEYEGKSYITFYQMKIFSVSIKMYRTPKMDIPEYFRVGFSILVSKISGAVSQDIHTRGGGM